MRGKKAVQLGYLWGFLESMYFLDEMFALASGSVQLNFGPMHLRKIKILRPPDKVLLNFERIIQPILRKVIDNRKQSPTLASIRDIILPKLISGQIRVKGAEKFVEKK